jgi:hypothetical protein
VSFEATGAEGGAAGAGSAAAVPAKMESGDIEGVAGTNYTGAGRAASPQEPAVGQNLRRFGAGFSKIRLR